MTDSVSVFQPGTRFIDASSNILAGGSIEFFDAETTNPKTVYSDKELATALGSIVYLDAGGAPVSEQGGSTKITVYVDTASYKVVVKSSAGVVLETKDNLRGAFDSASILANISIIAETEVVTITSDTTLTVNDRGKLYNVNTTGAQVVMTLPDANEGADGVANGVRYGFRMAGTDPTKALVIKTTSAQTIGGSGVASTSLALTKLGEEIWVVADGGNWVQDGYAPPLMSTVGVIEITDRLTAPPGSEPAGARYIISGSPTGGWSAFAQHNIVEADGQGGWRRFIPATDCGWIAYVKDEDIYYYFRASAWVSEQAGDTQIGTARYASAAEMQTGTATNRIVVPGRVKDHPLSCKAWGVITYSGGTPTLRDSENIAGITDTAQGRLTITIDVDFSSANYVVLFGIESDDVAEARIACVETGQRSAGSFRITMRTPSHTAYDPAWVSFACFGRQ